MIRYFKAIDITGKTIGIGYSNYENEIDFLFEQFETTDYSINYEDIDQLEYIILGLEKDAYCIKD